LVTFKSMDTIINLDKDITLQSALTRAKKEAKDMAFVEGIRHTVLFNSPKYYDLIIIELKDNKWSAKQCTQNQWTEYFYKFLYNKEKFKK
jgi:hypothetical protein